MGACKVGHNEESIFFSVCSSIQSLNNFKTDKQKRWLLLLNRRNIFSGKFRQLYTRDAIRMH